MDTSLIRIGLRSSPLSRAQLDELPDLGWDPVYVETHGDRDQKTSLRDLDKTNFFTRDIDQMQLKGEIRLSLHSAKDLPDPLPKGLILAALTKGVDPSDSLVYSKSLPPNLIVATSSERREEAVRQLYPNAMFVDIRGTVGERLEQLKSEKFDAVVIAEAALIRLKLDPPRLKLPGETTPLQGQLAILCRTDDHEMRLRLAALDSRPMKRTLYLGLESPDPSTFHYPVIKTEPLHPSLDGLIDATHVLFTSKTAVRLLPPIKDKKLIAVGQKTAQAIREKGCEPWRIASDECAEGILALLRGEDLSDARIFWPHSALSRRLLMESDLPITECLLYTTKAHEPFPPPDLSKMDVLYFTSPSCVNAFHQIFGPIPEEMEVIAQGPVTKMKLQVTHTQ